MVDSSRKRESESQGRSPLSSITVVPISCVVSRELVKALKVKSELFISPNTGKPYGVTALSRIILQTCIGQLDRSYEMDFLSYLSVRAPHLAGRAGISEETPTRVSLLIPKPIIDTINLKVEEYNNPLIGTSTIVRYLLEWGVQRCKVDDFYEYIPSKHMSLMISKQLTIKILQDRYRRQKSKPASN